MTTDEIIAPMHPDDPDAPPQVDVGNINDVDVSEDNVVINQIQRRRLAFIAEISPNGRIENKKDRYLYLAALKDTADSAQSRITAQNKVDDSERDRALVAETLAQMAKMGLGAPDENESGSIPTPSKRFTTKDIDPGIMSNKPADETHDEFRARMDDVMQVAADQVED